MGRSGTDAAAADGRAHPRPDATATMPEKLTVCIITLNEEERVRDCIESVAWADEIVVLDSFSSDGTLEICREHTDRVYQEELPSTAARREAAMAHASNEWVLSLDADERVTPELAQEIQQVLASARLDDYAAYSMPRVTRFLARWIRHGSWYPNRQVRLCRKSRTRFYDNTPHDVTQVNGRTGRLKHDLEHRQPESVQAQIDKVDRYSTIFAEVQHERGARAGWLSLLVRPAYRFVRNYVFKRGFLDGVPGLIIAYMGACHACQKYAKLWVRNHPGGDEAP